MTNQSSFPMNLSGKKRMCKGGHLHVDSSDSNVIQAVADAFRSKGRPCKINKVRDFIAGPQRVELPEIYGSHTPEVKGKEALDSFTTTFFRRRSELVEAVNFVQSIIPSEVEAVREVEQEVMLLNTDGWEIIPESDYFLRIAQHEVQCTLGKTLPFEIHHGFELPQNGPQIVLEKLLECKEVHVGGWFDLGDGRYRSNAFSGRAGVEKLVQYEQKAFNAFLRRVGLDVVCWSLVENIAMVSK